MYRVCGSVTGSFYIEVEADCEEDAWEVAEEEFGGFCHVCSQFCEDPNIEITSCVPQSPGDDQ